MYKEEIKTILMNKGYKIEAEERAANNYGDILRISNGCIINCYDKGTHNLQGKNTEEIEKLLYNSCEDIERNKNIFVVYGHDEVAKTQLEAMLRRWDLQPLILDQLVSSGNTIIEKLEEYISKASFGIVLATPDDIGFQKGKEDDKKCRVRQNVVLEMGMLLAKLGRSKVAILLKNIEEMEKPSDINGLIYIPFINDVAETTVNLAKELSKHGYILDISKL